VRFWDSFAIVSLFVEQEPTRELRSLFEVDDEVLAWTLSDVEVHSALERLRREESLSQEQLIEVRLEFRPFWDGCHLVEVADAVKTRALRLLEVHALRAADAMQLGAALAGAYDRPLGWGFVCLDRRLGEVARREGFTVLPAG
jgi:predicted nucleic acid-binding protein